ncbi:hypothetical protein ONZ45_g11873 [Pleurotus djamor]|nr:hypothetical protein ONZ45_g11873 [Pleurotus djamor]
MNSTTTTRVLSIPEILAEIFEFSDKRANASNLLVNKVWSREVINVEWRHVDSWSRMLELLAPVELNANTLGFSRPIPYVDYERFSYYASKVRSLTLEGLRFEPSLTDTLTRLVSDRKYVSNVKTLSCSIKDTPALELFVNPKLTSLSIGRIEDVWPPPEILRSALSIIRERQPPLVTLKFMVDYIYTEEDDEDLVGADTLLSSTLRSLTRLKSCHLPPDILSPAISEALSTLPHLDSLVSLALCPGFAGSKSSFFSTHLDQASFPSLRNLSITISFERAIVSFTAWAKSDTLTSLELSSEVFETGERFMYLSTIVSKTFPHLTILSITAYSLPPDPDVVSSIGEVGFDHLEPLLSLDQLHELSLNFAYPLEIYDSDVVLIKACLKNLTRLHLNPTPRERQLPLLHITNVLSALRVHSRSATPNPINDLGLYVDTSFDWHRRTLLDHVTASEDHRMHGMDVLDLGSSPLIHGDVVQLVEYLSAVLTDKCKIMNLSDEEDTDEEDPSGAPWNQFHEMLRVVKNVRHRGPSYESVPPSPSDSDASTP